MTTTELAEFIIANHDTIMFELNKCTSGNFAHKIANIKNILCAYKQFAENALKNNL